MMKSGWRGIVLFLIAFITAAAPVSSQAEERYLDSAMVSSSEIRLAIFYPSVGSIRTLYNLREKGLLDCEKLVVVGVYHEKERTSYERTQEYTKKNELDWVKYHKLSGEISRENLFGPNALTAEFEKVFRKTDGVLLFGGPDVPPSIYGKKTHVLTEIITPVRSFLEASFIFHLMGGKQDKEYIPFMESFPEYIVLGLCLGSQTINVGTGGTLVQDIWMKKYGKKNYEDIIGLGKNKWHTNPYSRVFPEKRLASGNMHRIKLKKEGKFCRMMGFSPNDYPYVMSSHHQMVGELGKNIRVIASSLDGKVVEAIESKIYPNVLGTQFHPESSVLWNPDIRLSYSPEDMQEISPHSILQETPKSMAFHKKIWQWFSDCLKKNMARRNE